MEKLILDDLVEYSSHKDRGVQSAAKSIVNLFRAIYPKMLSKKLRVITFSFSKF